MNMKHQGILSDEQAAQYKLQDYIFPKKSGSFVGTLEHRKMVPGKPCLMCYFRTSENRKRVLPVWENSKTHKYAPVKSDYCFVNDVREGSEWECEYEITDSGRTRFVSARMVSSANNETIYAVKFFILLIKRAFPRQLTANISVEKYSLSDSTMFVGKDGQTEYKVDLVSGDYAVTRYKLAAEKEKNACVLIDGKTFDSISKTYE